MRDASPHSISRAERNSGPENPQIIRNEHRTEKIVPVHRVSFWRGVLRDYLLRRCWMLKFLGRKRKRQLLRSLSSDPLPEGHPVDRDNFFCPRKPPLGTVRALCFYQVHVGCTTIYSGQFGCISSTLYFTRFRSLGRHASARPVSHKLCYRGRRIMPLFHAETFTLPPSAPNSNLCPLPH